MSCCKVKKDKEIKGKKKIALTKTFFTILFLIILYPLLYVYVSYLILKKVITGKDNKLTDIIEDLRNLVERFFNEREENNKYKKHKLVINETNTIKDNTDS